MSSVREAAGMSAPVQFPTDAVPAARAFRVDDSAPTVFDRISILRFPLVVSVIFYHSGSGGQYRKAISPGWVRSVIDFLSEGLGSIRMPALFLIAGYVFFLGVKKGTPWYLRKISSRQRSLMLPHIAWTTISIALISAAHMLPIADTVFTGDSVWSASLSRFSFVDWCLAYFGGYEHLFLYQLWFTRDLFLLCVASPLIYQFVRIGREHALVSVLLVWLWGIQMPLPISTMAFAFFTIGACLAVNRQSMFFADMIGPSALVMWLVYQVYDAAVDPALTATRSRILIALGVVAALYATHLLARAPRMSAVLSKAAKYSFCLFVMQEPTLTVVRKGLGRLLPSMPPEIGYFACPVATILLIVGIYETLYRVCPLLLSVLDGGRIARKRKDVHATSSF